MRTDFYRIERLPPYVFAEVNGMRAAMRAEGRDVLDLGMGNPDSAPPRTSSPSWRKSRPIPTRLAIRRPRASQPWLQEKSR